MIKDRGAEKWWAKKGRLGGSWLYFSAHHFFCHFKCTTDIAVDVNMPFNVNAFQRDQNVVDVLDSGCQNATDNPAAAEKCWYSGNARSAAWVHRIVRRRFQRDLAFMSDRIDRAFSHNV